MPHVETRRTIVAHAAIGISPFRSIHCGASTAAYRFCGAMAGDSVDMDLPPLEALC